MAEVEFQVARLTKLGSGNGAQGGTGSEELDVGEVKRLVAALSFMKRVLSRILRPPTLLQVFLRTWLLPWSLWYIRSPPPTFGDPQRTDCPLVVLGSHAVSNCGPDPAWQGRGAIYTIASFYSTSCSSLVHEFKSVVGTSHSEAAVQLLADRKASLLESEFELRRKWRFSFPGRRSLDAVGLSSSFSWPASTSWGSLEILTEKIRNTVLCF